MKGASDCIRIYLVIEWYKIPGSQSPKLQVTERSSRIDCSRFNDIKWHHEADWNELAVQAP